jgi:hypothetical protein
MRSQGLVGDYLAGGVPLLNLVSPAVRRFGPAAGYGAFASQLGLSGSGQQ